MRLAIFGDIHGNIEALQTAYRAVETWAGKADSDILVYGHTHKPYRKDFVGRVFINAGSVGKPKDGDPRAGMTMIAVTPVR